MAGKLDGKIALITGVGGGMGTTAAQLFCAEGARVAACDLSEQGAQATQNAVRAAGGEITVMGGVDLGDAAAAKAWVDAAPSPSTAASTCCTTTPRRNGSHRSRS